MSRVDETNAIAFNLRYPVGQPFRYYPIADEARFIETRSCFSPLGEGSFQGGLSHA